MPPRMAATIATRMSATKLTTVAGMVTGGDSSTRMKATQMRRILMGLVVVCGLLVSRGTAQERIALSVAETAPNNATYRVERFTFEEDDPATASVDEGRIVIQLLGVERPIAVTCVYNATSTPTATFLITGLNKANLSTAYAGNATTGSLKQRILHRLVVMAEAPAVCGRSLTGSLTGTPQ